MSENRTVLELTKEVSENEKRIKRLTDSTRKYKNLFNVSGDAKFVTDLNGKIKEVNNSASKFYGYTNKEFKITCIQDLLAKSEKINFKEEFNNITQLNFINLDTTLVTKKGKRIPVELIIQYFEINSRKSILITAKDISKKRKHEEELELEKYLLKTLMDNIPDTIYFKDLDSKFIRINKAQAELLGVNNCDGAIGKTDFDFFRTQHAEDAFNDEVKLFKTKKSLISKAEYIQLANGKSKWVTATKVPVLDNKGNVSGLVGMSRDITDLKNANIKIQKYAKELQYLNLSKDKFLSIIAHDLKNPFFSLLGFAELLEKDYEKLSDDERKLYLNNIIKISKNSYQLLENLLHWASAKTGRIEYCPEQIDLKTLVHESIEFFKPMAQKKNILLSNNVVTHLPAYADQDMIRTVLRNLLTNSIKFTKSGGSINVDNLDDRNQHKICVSDSGQGMDAQTIKNLFKISISQKSIGTSNETGTGLGLIICKEFVEKNGGQISITSKPKEGSTFSFTIPKFV